MQFWGFSWIDMTVSDEHEGEEVRMEEEEKST